MTKKDTTIYLIRHGQPSLPDDSKRFIGQSDVALSQIGAKQAELLGDRLKGITFNALYCSDQQICLATANILGKKLGLHVKAESEMREINLGPWDGLSFSEVIRDYPQEYERRGSDIVNYRIPGGESFSDLKKRVLPALCRILNETCGNILLVGPKGVNRLLLCYLLGVPLDDLFLVELSYCSVNTIRV